MTAGRPPHVAARGRVTLQQAAELAGVPYSLVYSRVRDGVVPSERDGTGAITIARNDVKLIKAREPAASDRKAVMIRVPLEEYAAWERAAGNRPVSSWLRRLGNAAAGYKAG